jgi:apolipoprotein D and lipocalin family protein
MNKILTFVFTLLLFVTVAHAADPSDPEVVPNVDLARYAGQWFEIAHNPNPFQIGCVRSTTEYTVISASAVSVHNTCYKADSTTSGIDGTATVVDPAVAAKLKVIFQPLGQVGDYWIVALDPDYQWAVVSSPAKLSLFILSRKAPMDAASLQVIVDSLKERGFETDTLFHDQY